MKRSLFLQLPLAASTLLAGAQTQTQPSPVRAKKGFKVEGGRDHFNEELLVMGGRFDCKVSAKDTGGDLCIYDTYRDEKGGPRLHMHHYQDEWFYIIKGEFIARIGEDQLTLKPGDSAFGPRKVPHAFAMTSDGEGQMLVLFQPAGSMEDFFKQMSKLGKGIIKDQENAMKELWRTHGIEILGPPLKF